MISPLQLTWTSNSYVLGDQVVRDSISDKLLTLVESIHGMNISFGQQSAEVVHEKSGIVPCVIILLNCYFTIFAYNTLMIMIRFRSVWVHIFVLSYFLFLFFQFW